MTIDGQLGEAGQLVQSREQSSSTPRLPSTFSNMSGSRNISRICSRSRVEVANRSSLKPLVRPRVERDAIYAF